MLRGAGSLAMKNHLLFTTELFLFHQRDEELDRWSVGGDCAAWFYMRLINRERIAPRLEPTMEDWGWTFRVLVDSIQVTVNVWAFFEIDNCWLIGVEANRPILSWRSAVSCEGATNLVCVALEDIITQDVQFSKWKWFTENPYKIGIKQL